MKQKTILFVYYGLSELGGVQRVMVNLANDLVKEGYKVEILLLLNNTYSYYPLDENIKVHSIDTASHWANKISSFNIKYLKFIPKIENINAYISHIGVFLMMKKWLNENHHHYDTIVSCWYKLSKFISFYPKVRDKTYAWEHISHTVGGIFYNKLLNNRYKHLKGVITINKPGETFHKKINPNTLNIYNIMDSECENKEFISTDKKENIISMVCRLDPEKNVSEFLDIIKESNIPNDWKVHIMGGGTQENMLKQKCIEENIYNVEFLGRGSSQQVYKLLEKSKINCLTSTAEGFGLILVEAMFHSNALIAYDCNYGPSDIVNQNNGFLIPLHNKQLFIKKLEYLTSNKEIYETFNKSSYLESKKWKKEKLLIQWKKIL